MSTTEKKTKGMCIATRCTSVEQFIQMFHRFVDEESFFVSTLNTRPPGLETSFSVQLVDGTPVLRGLCVVMQSWTDANNPFKTPGVRLGIKRLTANSMQVFERLLVTRSSQKLPAVPAPNAAPRAIVPIATKPGGMPVPKPPAPPSSLAVVVAVPKSLPKSPLQETAPTRSAPSRLELRQPVRPSSQPRREPIPEPVPAETTDLNDGPTDVREPRVAAKALADLPPSDLATPLPPPVPGLDTPPPPGPVISPEEIAAPADLAPPLPDDSRTPGSELVLPANPLMNLTDESLEGYVDCTLYEETGSYFPVDDPSFVDDVVAPPPIPGEGGRQRTITPLPAAPDAPGLDSHLDDLAARPDSSPSLGSGEDAALHRDSSPALVVPPPMPSPPMPRESVMVDPGLIARGSTPAFDRGDELPVRKSAERINAGALSVPAPVRAAPAAPQRSRWWLLAGVLGVLGAGAALLFVMQMSTTNGGAATPAPKQAVKELAQLAPIDDHKPATTDPLDEEQDPPPGEGPPVVGAGPCSVVVNTTPAGSIVRIDDVKVGPSPITVAATCAKHKLDISHARYEATSKVVELHEGQPAQVEVTLQRPTHIVTVKSDPPGATIFIDGRRAGTTPTKLSVLGFVTVTLEFKKTGFAPASAKLYSRYPNDQVGVRLTKW